MKVLLLIDSLGRGGAQRQVVNLALGLHGKGHQVSILTYYPSTGGFHDDLIAKGIPIDLVEKKSRFDLSLVSYLKKKVNEKAIDVVISFMITPNIYLELAAGAFKNTKVFVSERSSDIALKDSMSIKMRTVLHKRADKIISNSFEYGRLIRERYPQLAKKVVSIPNGLSEESFMVRSSDNLTDRNDDRVIFLAVSNIHYYKNYSNLIEAMGTLSKQELSRFKVLWAGRSPEKDNEQEKFSQAKNRIQELKLQDNFEWLGEVENVSELYRNADVFIHPSKLEGMSNSICEALAAGLPLLISRVADYEWLLDGENNGFSFDPDSVSEIANGILNYISLNKRERSSFGERGQEFALKNLSLDSLTEAYHDLIIS